MRKYFFQIALFTLSLFPTLCAQAQSNNDTRGYIVNVGDLAPDFSMKMLNGETTKLSSLRGKVVMLQFTASWCGVCRKEMPFIEKDIWQKHKDNKDFVLMGIDRGETKDKVEQLVKTTGITYPIGFDTDSGIFFKYAEKNAGITRNVIIDRDGRIVMLTRLFEPEEFKNMCNEIDKLLQVK
ncbi:MAG: TlpA disulfide reductase family protein [Bacteroidales bacterium]